jgi:hypothetical protein
MGNSKAKLNPRVEQASPTELTEFYDFLQAQPKQQFTYCYNRDTQVSRLNWSTGEELSFHLTPYQFMAGCSWTETPEAVLIVGGYPATTAFLSMDIRREFAVCRKPPMQAARQLHGSLLHGRYLYVLGGRGVDSHLIRGFERFDCLENTWARMPDLVESLCRMTVVAVDTPLCIYALGGDEGDYSELIHRFSFARYAWGILKLALPSKGCHIPVFKLSEQSSQVFFVVSDALYLYIPSESTIRLVQSLPKSNTSGPIYNTRGTLYSTTPGGEAYKQDIRRLLT